MQKLLPYLSFLATSTNQHGVHSPFVYDYVTKCLYSKPKKSISKSIDTLLKSISYFEVKSIWLPSNLEALQEQIRIDYPSIRINKKPYDLIFIDISDLERHFENIALNIHNDTLLLIDSIHENEVNLALWEEFKSNERVTVTLDMYYCSAVFFRKEQTKEHFKIRI